MSIRPLTIILLVLVAAFSGPALSSETDADKAYTELLAKSYADLFASVKGAEAGKALHMLKPDAFLGKVKAKEPIVVVDVRTPAETDIYSVSIPDALMIPISELFTPANLARIPTDQTVVVLCLSGTRATAAGTALRHIGFHNVYVLKGGYKALVAYMGPKEANTPPKTEASE